jgi:hypothetical protein
MGEMVFFRGVEVESEAEYICVSLDSDEKQ